MPTQNAASIMIGEYGAQMVKEDNQKNY